MIPATVAVPSSPEVAKCERYSPVQEYRNRVLSAKRELCQQLLYCFDALDNLTEPEFLEIMKTADNGTSASDLLEKFRKWKGI